MRFNVNDMVYVRLTDYGRECYRTRHAQYTMNGASHLRPEDEHGWSAWQLWELMHIFGPYLDNGRLVPFETEIEIPGSSLHASARSPATATESPVAAVPAGASADPA